MFGFSNASTVLTKRLYITTTLFGAALIFAACGNTKSGEKKQEAPTDSLAFLNHSDSAHYVGMNTCKLCHQSIYNTFIQTGMGQSFAVAGKKKSSGDFSSAGVYDRFSDLNYKACFEGDSMFICEYRLNNKDTTHTLKKQVNYIIGSGQHTNSHMHNSNGYITQMPMTFYTQKHRWDMPPGFENGINTRFSRKIGLECMSCHNGYPNFVIGSENKYSALPQGIDCERCHGPGSIHVALKQKGITIDTSLYADRSIVNPAKLEVDKQFDICQRCHLQGNAVLKNGHSFYDFRPGQKLSDFMTVFLPKYKNADDEFIMASHADRLKQSRCFVKSLPNAAGSQKLKPYKDALTCVSCHNPHVSVRATSKNSYNNACLKCHVSSKQELKTECARFASKTSNCVGCHMPASGSTDIPHVSVHDHYIRRPLRKMEKEKVKEFLGLFAINEKSPEAATRAKAYLNHYEKFDKNKIYLDSAERIIKKNIHNPDERAPFLIQLYYDKGLYHEIDNMLNTKSKKEHILSRLNHTSFSNDDAWTCYRVGESYFAASPPELSLPWFQRAVDLAPYQLDFRNKLGAALAACGKTEEAKKQFEFIMKENPEMVSPYSNLGYMHLVQNEPEKALKLYLKGEQLDPDNEALLLNLAGYYIYMKDYTQAKKYLHRILNLNPKNGQASYALKQLTH